MSSGFTFSFSGDDIEGETFPESQERPVEISRQPSAFPVQGKPLLAPVQHDLDHMLSQLPSKIAYSLLPVPLDDGSVVTLPRRELWDVRVQLMAEDEGDADGPEGLGDHDVKTGVYEGGFKSWESSVDLVKVLATGSYGRAASDGPLRVVELGCGTALPSLAVFQWILSEMNGYRKPSKTEPVSVILADYNPTVLELVTLPNFILAWALLRRGLEPALTDAFSIEGELELSTAVTEAFQASLSSLGVSLSFLSGGWSPRFVDLLYGIHEKDELSGNFATLILGSETIYSPFALDAFSDTVFSMLGRERAERPYCEATALVAAKRLYFGVGGSLDDFIAQAKGKGIIIRELRQETEGVRRGVVACQLPP